MALSRAQRQRLKGVAERLHVADLARTGLEVLEPARRRDRVDTEHFRRLIAFSMPRDAHCVDVGAHRGDLLHDMMRLCPDGRFAAFEPLPDFAAELRRTFDDDVTVSEVALWDEPGSTTFHHVPDEPAYSGLAKQEYPRPWTTREVSVRTARLDDELDADFRPDLIKIDVEGAELQVLRGGSEAIARHRPTLYIEHQPAFAATFGTTSGDLFGFLDDMGMRIFSIGGEGPLSSGQFERMALQGTQNWVCRT